LAGRFILSREVRKMTIEINMCAHPECKASARSETAKFCEEHALKLTKAIADHNEPPVGSWAMVARMMAENDDSGFDWDAWKDEMKDTGGEGYGP
jgi:hypothetical protein